MPPDQATRLLEHCFIWPPVLLGDGSAGELLHRLVMKLQEYNMQLPQDQVVQIAFIGNDRHSAACRNIAAKSCRQSPAQPECLRSPSSLVKAWCQERSTAIHLLQV